MANAHAFPAESHGGETRISDGLRAASRTAEVRRSTRSLPLPGSQRSRGRRAFSEKLVEQLGSPGRPRRNILAKSRLTKITNENPTDQEVTITAITA